MMKTIKGSGIYLLILLPLIYFAIFLHLDSLPFRIWDESYLAEHTYQMALDKDYIVVHNHTGPEMSNTKPPLAIWCMVAVSKMIGYNELAIRLPNAIAGMLICLLLFFFFTKTYDSPLAGCAVVMVLLSSGGFVREHVIRTGEYDSILLLFIVVFCLSYFLLLKSDGKRKRLLWFSFTTAVIGAVWTKGIAPMMVMPALLIYTIAHGKLPEILRSKAFYISVGFIWFFGFGYYVLREHYNHGYMHAVWENELGGRYGVAQQGHQEPLWYYLSDLIRKHYGWVPFFIIGVLGAITNRTGHFKSLIAFCTTICVTFFIVITGGETKLFWYDAPIVPFFAIIAGTGIYMVADMLFALSLQPQSLRGKIATICFILLVAVPGYKAVIDTDQEKPKEDANTDIGYYLKKVADKHININGYKVVYNDPLMQRVFLCEQYKLGLKGQKIEVVWPDNLMSGDRVIMADSAGKCRVKEKFLYDVMDTFRTIETWKLSGERH